MNFRTSGVNNNFWGTLVIPIPNWIAWFRWLDSSRLPRFLVISWGKNND